MRCSAGKRCSSGRRSPIPYEGGTRVSVTAKRRVACRETGVSSVQDEHLTHRLQDLTDRTRHTRDISEEREKGA